MKWIGITDLDKVRQETDIEQNTVLYVLDSSWDPFCLCHISVLPIASISKERLLDTAYFKTMLKTH